MGTPFATTSIVENGTPPDLQSLLLRFDAMEKEIAHLKSELARKDKIIAGLQQRLFGSSSEKRDPAQLQLELEELLLGKPGPPPGASGETPAPEEGKSNAAKTRRTKADRFPKNLKILVEKITIPEEVLVNPGDWTEIGEEHHDELDVTKAEIFWRRTIRKKFVHKTDKARPPLIAPAPLPSIPGTLLAPALAAQIITDKYQDHLPHYRQSQRFRRRHGADIGRQTLNTWTHATARHLDPIDRAIRAEILRATHLEIDETPIDYQAPGHGSVREGRLWACRDPVARTCYFDWHPGARSFVPARHARLRLGHQHHRLHRHHSQRRLHRLRHYRRQTRLTPRRLPRPHLHPAGQLLRPRPRSRRLPDGSDQAPAASRHPEAGSRAHTRPHRRRTTRRRRARRLTKVMPTRPPRGRI